MRNRSRRVAALLLAALLSLGLGACGSGHDGLLANGGGSVTLPASVSVKSGSIASDSWGYTGSGADQVAAPGLTEIVASGHTLLMDASRTVVSGVSPTTVSSSSDLTSLDAVTGSSAARLSAPGTLVSYLEISMGTVRSTLPALSVTVDVSSVAPGTALTVYRFDPGTGRWVSPQALTIAAGKVTFTADSIALWGIFR